MCFLSRLLPNPHIKPAPDDQSPAAGTMYRRYALSPPPPGGQERVKSKDHRTDVDTQSLRYLTLLPIPRSMPVSGERAAPSE